MLVIKRVPIIIGIILLLQACLATEQIEQTAIINSRGVDLIDHEGSPLIETTIVPYLFDPNAEDITSILIGRGPTIRSALETAAKQSSFLLSPGKIALELYGKEAAEAGVISYLNTLIRDARVSDRMKLAVTNQTAREVLEKEQQTITINPTEFLQDLIDKETDQGLLPKSELQYFTRFVELDGVDPILPIIDITDERPTLTGAAVFQKDRYVLDITLEESFLINQLRRRVVQSPLEAVVPLEHYQEQISEEFLHSADKEDMLFLALELNVGSGRIHLLDFDSLTFLAEVQMRGELLETSVLMSIDTEQVAKQLEKDLAAYYKAQYEQLFTKLQEVKADAFGIGRKYITTRRGSETSDEEWKEMLEDVKLEVKVDFTLTNYGTIE